MPLPRCVRPTLASALLLAACAEEIVAPEEERPDPPPSPACAAVEVIDPPASLRQGDVAALAARVTDADCAVIAAPISWSLLAGTGVLAPDGRFLPYGPGTARVRAASGALADTVEIAVAARGVSGAFSVVGRGLMTARYTSDLWLAGDYAYTGTWGGRPAGEEIRWGDRLYVWSVGDPANPVLTDSVVVDARTVNDVKLSADGLLAVITHEYSLDGQGGITLLDLTDPAHPDAITRFTDGGRLGSVHNVWIDGDFVYTSSGFVVDVSNPAAPSVAGTLSGGGSFIHDVYVRDGLAFVSKWDDGLVILDVGHGIRGGSPQQPVEVSRLYLDGQTHNAWYWPERGYVFVGREAVYAGSPPYGLMHVVDVSDLANPRRVATYRVNEREPHNFWVDEERGVLYAAWYTQGVRAVDVSGTLLGELERQGREIAFLAYDGPGVCAGGESAGTCTWAPQLHRGVVWVSDMNQGLVALAPAF